MPLMKTGMAPTISLKKVGPAPHPCKEASLQGGGGSNDYFEQINYIYFVAPPDNEEVATHPSKKARVAPSPSH